MNAHSAWRPTNSRPAADEPAEKIRGVRCGDGSDKWMALHLRYFPSCRIARTRRGIREHLVRLVPDRRSILPAALPQLVHELDILLRHGVSLIVRNRALQTHGARRRLEKTRDDVPRDPSVGQMVERGQPTGEQVRCLVGGVSGDPEAEVPGHGGHRWYQEHGIETRQEVTRTNHGVRLSLVHVGDAQGICNEDPVEQPAFAGLGEPGPVVEGVVFDRVGVGMRPQASPGLSGEPL
jgi:hypothetical protein